MRRASALSLALCVFGLSCQGEGSGPVAPASTVPAFLISDGVHSNGNEHFYFLPPLVPDPPHSGVADPNLDPSVVVCELVGSSCGETVARFSRGMGTGSELLRYDVTAEHYMVNWHTDVCVTGPCSLDPAKTYRLSVSVASVELGFADVDVVSNGSQLRHVQRDEYIGLLNGRTLPVKFRIEAGAIGVVPPTGGGAPVLPAEGGTVAVADGSVVLDIPPDALPASSVPTTITVEPAVESSLPESPTIVPGTTFDFGPDGTEFATPVTVRIAYDPASLPPGLAEEHLRLFTVVNGAWQLVPSSHVDLAANVIVGEVTHFSEYGAGTARPVAWICAYDLYQSYSGNVEYCDTGLPQGVRSEAGHQFLFSIMLRDSTHFAGGSDGSLIQERRNIEAVSSNPAIVRIDELAAPGENFVTDWIAELTVTLTGIGQASLYLTSESVVDTVPILVTGPTAHWNIIPYDEAEFWHPYMGTRVSCQSGSTLPTLHVGDTIQAMVEGCDEFNNLTGRLSLNRGWVDADATWHLEADCGGSPCDVGVVSLSPVFGPPAYSPSATLVATAPGHTRVSLRCGSGTCESPAPADIYVLPAP